MTRYDPTDYWTTMRCEVCGATYTARTHLGLGADHPRCPSCFECEDNNATGNGLRCTVGTGEARCNNRELGSSGYCPAHYDETTCEDECMETCAHPGRFSECEVDA